MYTTHQNIFKVISMSLDYSLAMISVAEIPASKLNTMNEKVHDSLREKFPLKIEELAKNVSINIDDDNNAKTLTKTSPVFAFVSADRSSAIIITCEQITFHSKLDCTTDHIVRELTEAFKKISSLLEINHVGNVAIRYIYNFNLSDDGSNFDHFNATNLLAPTLSSMPAKGSSMFESTYVKEKNIVRLKASVQMNTAILPNDLMEAASKQLKISTDRVNVLARMDIDTLYNCDGTYRVVNIDEISRNLYLIGLQADEVYRELQGV